MLRVNLMTDPEFREDILKMAKSLLKEVGYSIIVEELNKEDWLHKKVESYLQAHPIHKIIENLIRTSPSWFNSTEFNKVITNIVNTRIDNEVIKMAEKIVTTAKVTLNESIRDVVREELKKRFS